MKHDPNEIAAWMLVRLQQEGCLYQDDVVDHLIRSELESALVENADGNQVIAKDVLSAFRKLTETTVVWVKSDRYWRGRVDEDEPGRDARG